ncbi:MAG: hypothetical protein K2Q14_03290 [Gammaproteobacteria bacterium]|nr:hypothetical protein [Gammaproteobacteria bacterium]
MSPEHKMTFIKELLNSASQIADLLHCRGRFTLKSDHLLPVPPDKYLKHVTEHLDEALKNALLYDNAPVPIEHEKKNLIEALKSCYDDFMLKENSMYLVEQFDKTCMHYPQKIALIFRILTN